MGMNSEQIDWAKRNLKPGVSIVQLGEGDFREPFIIRPPLVRIPPVVGDREVAQSVTPLRRLPALFAEEYEGWTPERAMTIHAAGSSRRDDLSDVELRFLRAVVEHPGQKSSEYARLAAISGKRAIEIRKKLANLGYIREHRVATGGRGRNAIVLEPLEDADEVFQTRLS